jgi:hypothetical protein
MAKNDEKTNLPSYGFAVSRRFPGAAAERDFRQACA